ncbi:LysR family transcriptional regulator [Tistrella mobilis]|uniref:LysR family transcriptional regulator n=1 Tax=Tistrella mobilis TaxID=171437 RepID=UPI003558BB9A
MDRIDAMKIFIAALDEGSLAGAGRRLGRSPAAVSRAIAFLEAHVGAELLHRTTRSLRLSEVGEGYAAACRRVLADLEEADLAAAGEAAAPRGLLTLTAPVPSGEAALRPVLDAFLDDYPAVSARLHLLDRPVNLIEEGIDVALRIAHLPDSTLIALKLGEVRRVVVAAPAYLAARGIPVLPADLAAHRIIALAGSGEEAWSFPATPGAGTSRAIAITPRLMVNSVRAAVASAVAGHGVARVFSYHVADEIRAGRLTLLLAGFTPPPLPVHLITPDGRLPVPKVRAFIDFAVPRLKSWFADRATEIATPQPMPGSRTGPDIPPTGGMR